MRIVITGGAGFIGLAAAEALATAGHAVHLLDLAPPPRMPAGVTFAVLDATDSAALASALDGADALLPFAALTPDAAAERRAADRIVAVNIGGIAAALQATAMAGTPRVVMLSSVAVHGGTGPWQGATLTESSPVQPDSLYGKTKCSAEAIARHLAALHGIALTVLRLGPVFGPWEREGEARPDLSPHGQILAHLAAGRVPVLPHEMRADWLYSRDAGAAVAAVLEHGATGLYNLGAGHLSSPAEWAVAAGLPPPKIDPARANVTARVVAGRPSLDTAALQQACGFAGSRPLALAARDHMTWFAPISKGPSP